MKKLITRFGKENLGEAAVEYCLLAGLVGFAAVAGASGQARLLSVKLDQVAGALAALQPEEKEASNSVRVRVQEQQHVPGRIVVERKPQEAPW
ncbi:Flp family type IVb pilin [Allomesorhizobium camelthorni]|uniref:Flp family type IVb pilin n=1 Tax=Allomesorhizobium camelthorni TaxID=475069 RepID=A0A6G4WA54_9HYPH|nr:Flp family type IVb pilin [Mesorhizobium camelthorni]NGO51116.1 Flp family type IVb pilin [Mesorhizobium camelthorni]